ncbi:hypothetical protein ACLHIM_07075 [Ligilactobacillus sp. LYQ112]|uniref:hypothetical protein n=1 Tax=Ligilactobacillus sp. LYQ112 TaxID=3391060 RepID=UPI003983C751
MVKLNKISGYSEETYRQTFGSKKPIILIGAGSRSVMEYDAESNRPTGKIIAQKIDVYYKGLGVQEVKLPKEFTSSSMKDMSEVELISPEACIVNRNVYVRAKGVQ